MQTCNLQGEDRVEKGRKEKKQSLRRQKVKLCAVLSEKEEELRRRPSTSARVHSTELKHTCARIAYSSADETREEQHTRAPKLLLDPHPTRNVILQKANAAAAAGGCGARRTASSVVARPDGTGRRPGGRDGERGIGGRGEQGRRVSSPVDGVGGDVTASAPRSFAPSSAFAWRRGGGAVCFFRVRVCPAPRLRVCSCVGASALRVTSVASTGGQQASGYIYPGHAKSTPSALTCATFFFLPHFHSNEVLARVYMIIHDEMIYVRTVSGSSSYVGLICV